MFSFFFPAYQVLHEEKQYQTVTPHMPPNSQMEMLSSLIAEETNAVIEFTLAGRLFSASFLTIVADWDMDQVSFEAMQYVVPRQIFVQPNALPVISLSVLHLTLILSSTFLMYRKTWRRTRTAA
jgi:hypothetical protein